MVVLSLWKFPEILIESFGLIKSAPEVLRVVLVNSIFLHTENQRKIVFFRNSSGWNITGISECVYVISSSTNVLSSLKASHCYFGVLICFCCLLSHDTPRRSASCRLYFTRAITECYFRCTKTWDFYFCQASNRFFCTIQSHGKE